MLDLACGTGTLAVMMAKRGWKVWGIDGSEGMVAESVKKLVGNDKLVKFLHQDMRQFILPSQVILTTSFFDSLNHLLTPKDLVRTFHAVHKALLPDGYFIFDVSNELCYKSLWMRTETINHKDFTLVLKNNYNSGSHLARSDVELSFSNGSFNDQCTETVFERYFDNEEIDELLQSVGFHVLQRDDFNFTRISNVGKIKTWWVVQK
jgi:SAM-dependent methyltransferase